jgi:SAM (Sterile alpha motif) domain-containing protein
MDLEGWLRSLGLERYEAAFRDKEIDKRVLPKLTAEDLKALGVNAPRHQRNLLDAIAALPADPREVIDYSSAIAALPMAQRAYNAARARRTEMVRTQQGRRRGVLR